MAAEELKPQILLISLNLQPFFDEMYSSLINKLSSKANIKRAKTLGPALRLLSEDSSPPSAVLVTDEALSKKKNAEVWEAVLRYVRRGGTAVVMGHFSGFVKPFKMVHFFAKANLPWASGSYTRTTLTLNEAAVGRDRAATLTSRYSQKALYVQNVAYEDSWYVTDERSPTNAHVVGETPVALARVGDGQLGYLGDVNAESDSDLVILAMCGLSG